MRIRHAVERWVFQGRERSAMDREGFTARHFGPTQNARLPRCCDLLFLVRLAKGISNGFRSCFKLVSAIAASLAKDLMSDGKWAFFERFPLPHAPRLGASIPMIALL
jgi:hypothetical protein